MDAIHTHTRTHTNTHTCKKIYVDCKLLVNKNKGEVLFFSSKILYSYLNGGENECSVDHKNLYKGDSDKFCALCFDMKMGVLINNNDFVYFMYTGL